MYVADDTPDLFVPVKVKVLTADVGRNHPAAPVVFVPDPTRVGDVHVGTSVDVPLAHDDGFGEPVLQKLKVPANHPLTSRADPEASVAAIVTSSTSTSPTVKAQPLAGVGELKVTVVMAVAPDPLVTRLAYVLF